MSTQIAEPLFEEETRLVFDPEDIKYPLLYKHLELQEACFWRDHEIDLSHDMAGWNTMKPEEKHFIKMVLGFFGTSDLLVNEIIEERFSQEAVALEHKMLYDYQKMMENIHSRVYGKLLNTYVRDKSEREHIFNAVKTIPSIEKKAGWVSKWVRSDDPYSHRLIAMAAVEGIFFSGSFCAIFWMKKSNKLPGLITANKFIARDEGLHVKTAQFINSLLIKKAPESFVHDIIREAVDIEIEFIADALQCKLIGMNVDLMTQYIKHVANYFLKQFGYAPIYQNVKQPFDFMEEALDSKSNFFEIDASEYSKNIPVSKNDPYKDVSKYLAKKISGDKKKFLSVPEKVEQLCAQADYKL